MKINQYNEVILNEKEILSGLYSGKITSLSKINVDDSQLIEQFNDAVDSNGDRMNKMIQYVEATCSLEEFDKNNQTIWLIPEQYKNFDIAQWLLDQCKTDIELNRVVEELELFLQYNMIDVLICLKYLVDYMRSNDIVWGVGRGSSVASYCLYLIGIHHVNSLKYQLDIKEFLKGNENDQENL